MVEDKQGKPLLSATPTHPGEVLDDELQERGISQRELATKLGVSEAMISSLIHGKKSVSIKMALDLETHLGIDAEFWLNLQRLFDQTVAYHRMKRELSRLSIPETRQAKILSPFLPV